MYKDIVIEKEGLKLEGHIVMPDEVKAWVIFVHGSGSSRKSKRNNWVARQLNEAGYATLLFDLLTPEEDLDYDNRFNIPLLTDRILLATKWLVKNKYYSGEDIAFFGASTGAAAAINGAALIEQEVPLFTIISRGGRPDLADKRYLNSIKVPVLLIVGELDEVVIKLNQKASDEMADSHIKIVKGATHLFEEPGTLQRVVDLALKWLEEHMPNHYQEMIL